MKYYTHLEGVRFSRLVALRRVGVNKHGSVLWRCKCDCGNEVVVSSTHLQAPVKHNTRSCGCLKHEYNVSGDAVRIHGFTGTPEYHAWKSMIQRCSPKYSRRRNYLDRGIQVCPEWRVPGAGARAFIRHVGLRPSPKHSLDRINNDLGYQPGNVRWATIDVQNSNKRKVASLQTFSNTEVLIEVLRRELSIPITKTKEK